MDDDQFDVPVKDLPYADELKTCLPYTESMLRVRIAEAVGAASTCWKNLDGEWVFHSEKAAQVADNLTEKVLRLTGLGEPTLGGATTKQLLDELTARIRSLGNLDSRAVD